jgi:DNA-binding LacI/PurR family transcriptional regulator
MDDVAARAGVSRALVSLVMRDAPNVSDRRRAAVHRAAEELGYRPNVLARSLASRRSNTIGVVINDLHNPFFAEAVDGILDEADAAGYFVLMATGGRTRKGESGAIESLHAMQADGLILAGSQLAATKIKAASDASPLVLLSRALRADAIDTVNNDEQLGADLVVSHLVSLGHRCIAHIDGGKGAGAAQRRAGYERSMSMHGLGSECRVVPGDFTDASGAAGVRTLLEEGRTPTAVFAANDLMAVGAMGQAEQLGYRIPHDLSIVGYDNSALADISHMSLTTINQPRTEMGQTAVRLLLERLDGDRVEPIREVVTPTLVERSSTSSPRRYDAQAGNAEGIA